MCLAETLLSLTGALFLFGVCHSASPQLLKAALRRAAAGSSGGGGGGGGEQRGAGGTVASPWSRNAGAVVYSPGQWSQVRGGKGVALVC